MNGYTEHGCKEAEKVAGVGITCENCPFEKCRYEYKPGEALIKLSHNDVDRIQDLLKEKSTLDVAILFGVSQRTIQRVKNRTYAGIKE